MKRTESGLMAVKGQRGFKQTMQAHGMVSFLDADIYDPAIVSKLTDLFPKGIMVPKFLRGAKLKQVTRETVITFQDQWGERVERKEVMS